eukprot:TRINITY_DN8044_c0_g1_i6.p1 TRINITY_DN8044_c0_g1~~TRINITY_DN8044_c0_g1_i6.p1  ORF type:complete len:206 (-),score=27.13 TRINITY_DN8044_c0_g1_i6:783-1400(-)
MHQPATPFVVSTLKENSPLKRSLEIFRRMRPSSAAATPRTVVETTKASSQFKSETKIKEKNAHKLENAELPKSCEKYIEVNEDTLMCLKERKGQRHTTNSRFIRLVDTAIDHFSYRKRQVENCIDERKSESESFDEANESISVDEFVRKKQEICDIQKEIGQKDRMRVENQRAIQKLQFDINSLRAVAKDPTSVFSSNKLDKGEV